MIFSKESREQIAKCEVPKRRLDRPICTRCGNVRLSSQIGIYLGTCSACNTPATPPMDGRAMWCIGGEYATDGSGGEVTLYVITSGPNLLPDALGAYRAIHPDPRRG